MNGLIVQLLNLYYFHSLAPCNLLYYLYFSRWTIAGISQAMCGTHTISACIPRSITYNSLFKRHEYAFCQSDFKNGYIKLWLYQVQGIFHSLFLPCQWLSLPKFKRSSILTSNVHKRWNIFLDWYVLETLTNCSDLKQFWETQKNIFPIRLGLRDLVQNDSYWKLIWPSTNLFVQNSKF